MGVAGVALLWGTVSLIMSFVALFRYLKWRDNPIVKGRVGDCLREEKIKDVVKSHYAFTLETENGEVTTEYVSAVKKNKTPPVQNGDEIEVFYDAAQNKYKEIKLLKKDLWKYPLTCLGCFAVLILCFVITAALNP